MRGGVLGGGDHGKERHRAGDALGEAAEEGSGGAAQAATKGEAVEAASGEVAGGSVVVEGAGHEPSLYGSLGESPIGGGEGTGEGPGGEARDGLEGDEGGGGALKGGSGGRRPGEVDKGGGERSGCVGADEGTGDGLKDGGLLGVMNLGGGYGGGDEGVEADVARVANVGLFACMIVKIYVQQIFKNS